MDCHDNKTNFPAQCKCLCCEQHFYLFEDCIDQTEREPEQQPAYPHAVTDNLPGMNTFMLATSIGLGSLHQASGQD